MTARPPPALCENCLTEEAVLFAATVEGDSATLTPRGLCMECAKIADPLRRPIVIFCQCCRGRTATSFETTRSKFGKSRPKCLCWECRRQGLAVEHSYDFWLFFRVSLGWVLLFPLALLSTFSLYGIFLSRNVPQAVYSVSFFCFFSAQACAVLGILIFRRTFARLFRSRPKGGSDPGGGSGPGPTGGAMVPAGPRGRPPVLSATAEFPEADASAA